MNEDTDNTETLKKAINNLVWMYSPGHTTLDEAEVVALKILEIITEGFDDE